MRFRKIIKRLIPITVMLVFIIAGAKGLSYMLNDDTDSYTRLTMHEFYEQDNIDILFLGASHCFRGINPYIIDEKSGKNTFLMCTANQWMDASSTMLREADRFNDIDEIFVEISSNIARRSGSYKDRQSLTSIYIISDLMKPSLNKLNLLLNASSADHYVNSFWPARRYWDKITDFQYIDKIMQKKSTSKYRDYTYYYANQALEGRGSYEGKGYTAMSPASNDHEFMIRVDYKKIETEDISGDWIHSLIEIIDYCETHGIKLTLFATPVSYFELSGKGNYDDYIAFVKDLIRGKNVRYVDFNLIKEDYLPYRQSNYQDGTHLNMYGAEVFSSVLADYINETLPEDAFHASVKEKLQAAKPDYYGVSYTDDYKEQNRIFRLVSNIPDYFEYQVEITSSDGETHLLQEYDTNSFIPAAFEMIPGCVLHVTYRPAGSSVEGTLIDYPYMEAVY